MQSSTSPHLTARGNDYWTCPADELPALLAWLRACADLIEWDVAAHDKKSFKEITRFHHKPPGYRGFIAGSGIVLDRGAPGVIWLRIIGPDPTRARRIVEGLADGGVVEEVQSCLF